ncbi:MAG: hypothetical protein PHN88_15310 [Ignavibacteria bacterium]|nr:hypothetical protein [Ignavibacteria bacterium]
MKTILIILFCLSGSSAFCQSIKTPVQKTGNAHSLGLSLGLNNYHSRDEYLSPVIFSGNMFYSGLHYQLNTGRYMHNAEASYSFGNPDSDVQPRDVKEKIGYFSYSFVRLIGSEQLAGNPLEIRIGGGVSSFAAHTDFDAVDKTYNYTFYDRSWYWSHSVNLLFGSEYKLSGQNNISVQISLPVFSLVSRPREGHHFDRDNLIVYDNFLKAAARCSPEYLWDNFVIHFEAAYKQKLDENISVSLNYRFNYSSIDRPYNMRSYMNQFFAGIDYTF